MPCNTLTPASPEERKPPPLSYQDLNSDIKCVDPLPLRALFLFTRRQADRIHAHATFDLCADRLPTQRGGESNGGGGQHDHRWWIARMSVCTSDMRALMQHGFHWDEANVVPSASVPAHQGVPNDLGRRCGYQWTAYFTLRSHPASPRPTASSATSPIGPRWRATLKVCFRHRQQLDVFRVSFIHKRHIMKATVHRCYHPLYPEFFHHHHRDGGGSDTERFPCYSYKAGSSAERSFNTICADLPLSGFWPWPESDQPGPDYVGTGEGERTAESRGNRSKRKRLSKLSCLWRRHSKTTDVATMARPAGTNGTAAANPGSGTAQGDEATDGNHRAIIPTIVVTSH